jgi:hypothetical protein
MPPPKKRDVRRMDVQRGRTLNAMFWAGVALAPLAVLVLLFGQGVGSLRVAVTLTVLTVVLISVSVALRPSVELLRAEIEGRALDEVDQVRLHIREDIALASRNTHRALNERIQALAEALAVLRAQLDDAQAVGHTPPPRPAPAAREAPPAGPGVVRRTETVHVTHRTTTVDEGDDHGTVYGTRAGGNWPRSRGERPSRRALRRADDPYGRARRDDQRRDEPGYDEPDDRRHDERRRDDDRGYEARRDDDRGYERRRDDDRGHEVRGYEVRGHEDRAYDDRGYEDPYDRAYEERRYDERRYEPPRYDDVATGDRWASVHADEQGRELRVGERRSSVRSDERGTEFRVEDRWAALRRDDRGFSDPRGEPGWEAAYRSMGSRAALPAARGEPLDDPDDWSQARERERERVFRGDDPRYGAEPRRGGDPPPYGPRGAHPGEYDR